MPNLAHFWKKQRFKRHGASKAVNYEIRCRFISIETMRFHQPEGHNLLKSPRAGGRPRFFLIFSRGKSVEVCDLQEVGPEVNEGADEVQIYVIFFQVEEGK